MADAMTEGNSELWGHGADRQILPQRGQERSNREEVGTHC